MSKDSTNEKQDRDTQRSGGPSIEKPKTRDLLKRMRKVDPECSRRYRQRTGQ